MRRFKSVMASVLAGIIACSAPAIFVPGTAVAAEELCAPQEPQNWPGRSKRDEASYALADSGNYSLGPDSLPHPDVPKGKVTHYCLKTSRAYPGNAFDYWIFVPEQYRAKTPACLMVVLDGQDLMDRLRAPTVLENLIHKHEIPVMLGVFVNPGNKGPGLPIYGGSGNRSVEYDSIDGTYAKFLMEDLLPEVSAHYNISADPECRGVLGISSSGIAAFTVAWQRPDSFHRVVSFVGSFTDIRRGNVYPAMIRKSEKKPIRVFLQSGANDLNIVFGNWAVANQDMASALSYRDYDYKFVFGDGGHSPKHAAAILPDALRWLWR